MLNSQLIQNVTVLFYCRSGQLYNNLNASKIYGIIIIIIMAMQMEVLTNPTNSVLYQYISDKLYWECDVCCQDAKN